MATFLSSRSPVSILAQQHFALIPASRAYQHCSLRKAWTFSLGQLASAFHVQQERSAKAVQRLYAFRRIQVIRKSCSGFGIHSPIETTGVAWLQKKITCTAERPRRNVDDAAQIHLPSDINEGDQGRQARVSVRARWAFFRYECMRWYTADGCECERTALEVQSCLDRLGSAAACDPCGTDATLSTAIDWSGQLTTRRASKALHGHQPTPASSKKHAQDESSSE
jgi:hypothetical protein